MDVFLHFCKIQIFLVILFFCSFVHAEKYAVVIQLRSGTPELKADTAAQIAELGQILTERRYQVSVADTAAEIRDSLSGIAAKAGANDELALYILGYASVNARRISLSTANGRMTADELAKLLDGIKCPQTLYLFNSGSAALLAKLADETKTIVSAQDDPGQLGPPRYPAFYLKALRELPADAPLADVLAKAGQYTEKFYRDKSLALAENSQIYRQGKRISYPFDGSNAFFAAPGGKRTDSSPDKPLSLRLEQQKRIIHPPTPETLKELADAAEKAKQFADYPALYLQREASYLLNPDKSALAIQIDTFYINDKTGAAMVAPGNIHAFGNARLIYPDGSYCEITSGALPTPPPGSILRLRNQISIPRPNHLPEFQTVYTPQSILPACGFTVSFPDTLKHKFYNLPGEPVVTRKGGRLVYTFDQPLPACELLPFDAYPDLVPAWLVLTTLPGWDEFMDWVERMTNRAGEMDADAKTVLTELVKGADGDRDKVKRIYDYLNTVRYVTTPLGAAAFRPQTPGEMIRNGYGDCKDKANALCAMCAELNIKAERVLVNRGSKIDPSFPCWQFNHMIVYLPEHNLWLDATDNLAPFGDLPPGDAGSAGLIIGKPVRFADIKQAKPSLQLLNLTVRANDTATLEIVTEGLARYDWERMLMLCPTPQKRRFQFETFLDAIFPGAELISYELKPKIRFEFRYNGGLPSMPEALTKPFLPSDRKRPVRLFDGRKATFEYHLVFADKTFDELQWSKTAPTHAVSLTTSGNRVDFRFVLEPAPVIKPAVYRRIRADVYELYRKLNLIREVPNNMKNNATNDLNKR